LNKTLQLVFSTEEGRTVSMSLTDPVEPIVAQDVEDVMDLIVLKDIFLTNSGAITGKVRATLVARESTSILEF
jgi:hypothetical protein